MENSVFLFFLLGILVGYLLSGSKGSLIQVNFNANFYLNFLFKNNGNGNFNHNQANKNSLSNNSIFDGKNNDKGETSNNSDGQPNSHTDGY